MGKRLFIVLTLAVAIITIIMVSMSQKYRRKKIPLYMRETNVEDVYIDEKKDLSELAQEIDLVYPEVLKERSDLHFKKYLVESIPRNDYKKLINLDRFEFTTLGKTCVNSTFILILVYSTAENSQIRNTIRKTWAQSTKNITTLFILGSTENPTLQRTILDENLIYNDIVQGSMLDSDKNYIYKYVMGLKYALYFCPQAHYIVKVHDDTYINVPILKKFLVRKFEQCGDNDLIQCLTELDPTAESSSPYYCTNHAVIFSWDVAFRLYHVAQESEFYGNHEAFITGKLAREFHLQHKDIRNYTIDFDTLDEIIFSNGIKGKRHFIFGPRDLDYHLMSSLWDVIGHIDSSNVVLPPEQC